MYPVTKQRENRSRFCYNSCKVRKVDKCIQQIRASIKQLILGNCSSCSLDTNLGGSNPVMSTFEHRDKVLVLLVDSLLHVLMVIHPLLDVVAENSQLRQFLLDVLRHLHLLQVKHPSVQNSNGSFQALLSAGKVLAVSLGNTKLIMRLSNRPRISRQSLQPLGKTGQQILHSLLEVRILKTHLSQENQRLTLLDLILHFSINNFGKVKHLPCLLQVARLLSLLSISLHLVLSSVLFSLLSVVGIVSFGKHLMFVKVVCQSVSNLLFNLCLLFSGQPLCIFHNHTLGRRSFSVHVDTIQSISKDTRFHSAQLKQSFTIVEVGLSTLCTHLTLQGNKHLAGLGEVGHCIRDGRHQKVSLPLVQQLKGTIHADSSSCHSAAENDWYDKFFRVGTNKQLESSFLDGQYVTVSDLLLRSVFKLFKL